MATDSPLETKRPRSLNHNQVQRNRYLVMLRTDDSQSFRTINPFQIQKGLDAIAGPVQSCTRMRSGGLLIETRNRTQSDMLLKATRMLMYPVRVELHRTLNNSRGVVRSDAFDGMSEAEILENLQSQCVIGVKRVMIRRGENLLPTRTIFLTFNQLSIPEYIKAGYERISVRQYIPSPLRCFNCHKYGHTKDNCRSPDPICIDCAMSVHDGPCSSPPFCTNCQGPHASNYPNCPRFLEEKKIQEIRVKERLSYFEAKQRVATLHPTFLARGSFSRVVARPVVRRTISTQTLEQSSDQLLPPLDQSTSSTTSVTTVRKPHTQRSSAQTPLLQKLGKSSDKLQLPLGQSTVPTSRLQPLAHSSQIQSSSLPLPPLHHTTTIPSVPLLPRRQPTQSDMEKTRTARSRSRSQGSTTNRTELSPSSSDGTSTNFSKKQVKKKTSPTSSMKGNPETTPHRTSKTPHRRK